MVSPHGFDQAVFAEFPELIFRFSNAVTKCNKNIAWVKFDRLFFVVAIRKQTNNGPARSQTSHRAVAREDDRRQMTRIGVSQPMLLVVVTTKEKSGIFLWLCALQ